jgi:hypothetical protein
MVTHTAEASLDRVTLSSVVDRYFTSFNAADYRAVADLFENDGIVLAPFEAPIVGGEAIYTYLQAEAIAMQATPVTAETIPKDNGTQQVVVEGRVKTLLFTVNVRWTFDLTAMDTIQSVEIKLLASLQELMQFDRGKGVPAKRSPEISTQPAQRAESAP